MTLNSKGIKIFSKIGKKGDETAQTTAVEETMSYFNPSARLPVLQYAPLQSSEMSFRKEKRSSYNPAVGVTWGCVGVCVLCVGGAGGGAGEGVTVGLMAHHY